MDEEAVAATSGLAEVTDNVRQLIESLAALAAKALKTA